MKAETVRTVFVVTIVTLLVWLFAESRTLRTQTVIVPVEISPGGAASAFRLTDTDEWAGSIEVELAGPTAVMDSVRTAALEGITLEIGGELPSEPGVRTVELIDAIRQHALFAESGLVVRRVSPRLLALEIDRLESLVLPIEVDLEGMQTSGPVTVEPSEVTVRLPASIAQGLELHANAKIPPSRLSTLTPGRRTEISQVPIEVVGLPEGAWGIRLQESRAVVNMAIRVKTESLTLREIPVRLSVIPADLAVWTMEMPPEDRVLEDVVLTGPKSAIEQIRRGDIVLGAIATVDLDGSGAVEPDALERQVLAPVRLIGLPSGVFSEVRDRAITVTLRRRAAVVTESE